MNDTMNPEGLAFRLTVKDMNDKMNPTGLVPSLLVFGVPTNRVERMSALEVERT